MTASLLVAVGGAIGSVARFQLGELATRLYPDWKFPIGTFVVNILGCLAIGLLAGMAERPNAISPELKRFLFVGILGGFTTYSAFGLETMHLVRRGNVAIAGSYVALSIVVGFVVCWFGFHATAPPAVK